MRSASVSESSVGGLCPASGSRDASVLEQPVVFGDRVGDTSAGCGLARGQSLAEAIHPPVDERGDAVSLAMYPSP